MSFQLHSTVCMYHLKPRSILLVKEAKRAGYVWFETKDISEEVKSYKHVCAFLVEKLSMSTKEYSLPTEN
jgi:hypothetical protein